MEGLLVKVTPFIVWLVVVSAKVYYVIPSSNTACPEEGMPCFTLSQYATKPSNYFASTTTLILLPGNHILDLELSIGNIQLLIVASNTISNSDTSITCHQSAKFTFQTINVVSMRGIVFLGCVNNKVARLEQFTLEDCSFQGQGRNGTGLEVNEVFTANIIRSSFTSNTGREILREYGRRRQTGGAIIVENSRLGITISDSTLNNNTVTGDSGCGGAVYAESSPITIVNSTLNSNTVNGYTGIGGAVYADSSPITISNSVLNSNTVTGDYGFGGAVFAGSSPITIDNSVLNSNTVTGDYGYGGAVFADSSPITISNSTLNSNTVTGDYRFGGAVCADSSSITIDNSVLNSNTVTGEGGAGGVVFANSSSITIDNSTLNSNTVTGDYGFGGAVYADSSSITIDNSVLNNNTVTGDIGFGGAVYADSSPITISNSTLNSNTVTGDYGFGGAVYADSSSITIDNSVLNSNTVTGEGGAGGVVFANSSSITIDNSTLNSNTVTGDYGFGGAVYADSSSITIDNSVLNNNTVTGDSGSGGVVFADSSPITISNSTLNSNTVIGKGSTFYLISSTLNGSRFLELHNNMASVGLLFAVESTLHLSGDTAVSNNYGSLFVYSSNITFMGNINIVNNSYLSNTFQEGGAVTGFQSAIVFTGTANLMYNRAIQGGAISATQSKLHMYGDITVSHNTASVSGGGIYAYQSELNFMENINISRNIANNKGGGIHAISSTTRLTDGSQTYLTGNHAKKGGGMSLEGSAKIYLLKTEPDRECSLFSYTLPGCNPLTLQLNHNTADYGGAVYIADDTNFATCYATPFSDKTTTSNECFIQGLGLYQISLYQYDREIPNLNILNNYFTENSATVAGDALYGGLLDRCGASPFAEIFQKYTNFTPSSLSATSYIVEITDLEIQDLNSTKMISSYPVRVCFCRDNRPDCSYNPQQKFVRKGETFTVSLVAVDQINNTISNSKIHASVRTDSETKLGEGQSIQLTNESCTDMTYSILSPRNSEKLHLYAEGPCMSVGVSTANLTVNIAPCPIGFKDKGLRCICDSRLYPEYITNCFIDSETVLRKDNAWFAHVNVNTTGHQGYILHKYYPFDYCQPPTKNISVNLNIKNGANELCAFNRSGKLCGSCEDGLSLSLGSSRCRPCSNDWLALLIGFAITGVALVAFLLELNFTVAVGTFNGLIFYANIFAANHAIFFPHDDTKMLTIFIAWLNLDFGFETCFYDGMDGYAKTWLQFVFPLYVISLVVAIIIISDHSNKFAGLFVGKNPIAMLATLILLSYTKLLRTIIASLSFTKLQYSDGSYELVWLIDASVSFFSGKHIPLFITALVIAFVGITYTFVLFGWQRLVYCPNRGPLRWIIGNTKVIAFIDAYHNPYNKDHRYWIGLLLLVRVALYLVSAVNVLGDPRINLLSITLAIVFLVFFQRTVERKCKNSIQKSTLNEMFETVSVLNLAGLTIATFFITEDKDSQNVVAYISTGIAFTTFLAILVYHMYQFVLKRLFQNIADRFCTGRPQNQILVDTAAPMIADEEPVSETEFDALPEHKDTCTEEQFVTAEDDFTVGIEPAEVHTEPDTRNKVSHIEIESPNLTTHAKMKTRNLTPHIPTPGHEKTSVEIELPNLASGHDLAAVNFCQASVTVEASQEDDYESLEEDESTPLLQQD